MRKMQICGARRARPTDDSNILLGISIAALLILSPSAHSADKPVPAAEILSVQGKGEFRDAQQTNWRQAIDGQALQETQFVRTGDASKIGLLFADKTQMRLGQNSMMQLVSASKNKDQKTSIDLKQGRTWMQTKSTPSGLEVRTPSALAAIRGTDWELVVDEDGKTTLSVFSGAVDLSNEAGAVSVRQNEQAVVEKGRAPVKTTLVNPADRIQWVSSFTVNPARYAEFQVSDKSPPAMRAVLKAIAEGRCDDAAVTLETLIKSAESDTPLARLLLADCLVYRGDVVAADSALREGERAFANDPRGEIARARIALMRGDAVAAKQRANAARRIQNNAEVALLDGDIAAYGGDSVGARIAYQRAVSAAPGDPRAFVGLGRVESEKFNIDVARALLGKAANMNQADASTLGEVGLNETVAGNFEQASLAFDKAIAMEPSNYVVRTSLAALRLRQGRDEDALDELLRANVIEPRYARAHVLLAIAYYRMDRTDRAMESLARAKALDPNDPFPYQVASVINTDHWQTEAAVNEATGALTRLPFLKSLNQFADNQRGAANLGAALSAIGLESWAQDLAQESYQPLWASSHLFLADRYAGQYAKRSELMQGFLLDPLVFGATSRYQPILPRPGMNVNAALRYARSRDASTEEPVVTVSGNARETLPFAYFGEIIDTRIKPGNNLVEGTAKTYSAAFGLKPSWDRGLFLYVNRIEADVAFGKAGVDGTYQKVKGDDTRFDLASNLALDGANQIWLKAGYSRQNSVVDTATRSSNPIIPGLIAQLDSNFDLLPKSSDAQFRWTRTYAARNSIAAGLEWAESTRPQQLRQDNFSHLPGEASPRSTLSISDKPRSTIGYAFVQVEDGSIEWQGLLSYTSFSQPRQFESVGPPPFSFRFAVSDPFSRNGVAGGAAVIARLAGGGVGRLACSRWQRPVSNGTLAPVSLGGIVVDDQLVNAGGRSDRCHIQAEHQIGTSTFVLASYDYQKIDNLTSRLDGVINTGTEISNLDRLRNRAVAPPLNFNELESRPVFGSARVSRLQLGLDQLVTASVALRANYTQADSQNTSPDLRGKWIPYLPRSQLNFWLSYTMPSRGVISVGPVYRSKRFADEANLSELQAGWDTEVRGYWEFDKKRWAVEAFAQNLAKKQTARVAGANISYRY